jgi:hypothetical protein
MTRSIISAEIQKEKFEETDRKTRKKMEASKVRSFPALPRFLFRTNSIM